jgi:hypothetical protein
MRAIRPITVAEVERAQNAQPRRTAAQEAMLDALNRCPCRSAYFKLVAERVDKNQCCYTTCSNIAKSPQALSVFMESCSAGFKTPHIINTIFCCANHARLASKDKERFEEQQTKLHQ